MFSVKSRFAQCLRAATHERTPLQPLFTCTCTYVGRFFSSFGLTKFAPIGYESISKHPYPILFLHGAWDDAKSWEGSAEYFANKGHITATLSFSECKDEQLYEERDGIMPVNRLVKEVKTAISDLGPLTIVVAHCLGSVHHYFYVAYIVCGTT